MSPKKDRALSTPPSEVCKFYEGKSLFITGAAGFLGIVLLEILLRCCPLIHRIFILVRPKKGQLPEARKESLFKQEIFSALREKNPDVFNKVVVVSGDVTRNDLGMSSEDIEKVSQEATVVFHCAAAISFTKPLSYMIQQNVVGTSNILELCRKLKKLDVLIYTSTAYSNCNHQTEIEERIYEMPFTAENLLKVYKRGVEKDLMEMFSKCKPSFPNFYTFAKCVSETLITEKAADLPVCIVRPSIIINCLYGPHAGFIADGSAIVNLAVGVGRGFIRVILCDPDKNANQIPADVVANTHILAGYMQVAESLPSPTIYNCASGDETEFTWKVFTKELLEMVLKHPLPNSYQKPSLYICKSQIKYWLVSICDHYAPAFIIDAFLFLTGRKPRLVKLYRFYDKCMDVTMYFRLNEWTFRRENFESLTSKVNATDAELFPVDLKYFNLEAITKNTPQGAPVYRRATSNKPRRKTLLSRYLYNYMTPLIKLSVLGSLASALYLAVF